MDEKMRTALEAVSAQSSRLLHSRPYRLGKRITDARTLIAQGDLKKLIDKARIASRNGQVPVNPDAKSFYADAPYRYENIKAKEEKPDAKRIAVYTSLFGNYDTPLPLVYKEPGVDYFFITDMKVDPEAVEGWTVISADGLFESPFYANRYCKMHPFDLFPGYEMAIYVDGNILPISDVTRFGASAQASETGIAAHGHPERTCVYDEARTCLLKERGDREGIRRWVKRLESEGMPRQYGLLEMGVIIYDLHSAAAKILADSWFETTMGSGTKRDQLALPYVAWKNGYRMQDFGIIGASMKDNPAFCVGLGHITT